MKLFEILEQEQLNEKALRRALGIGALTTAGIVGSHLYHPSISSPQLQTQQPEHVRSLVNDITVDIVQRYKIDPKLAHEIVLLSIKYQNPDFPKAVDLLSLIGVESSFNSSAESKLKHDPAIGLLQVRPKTWNLAGSDLSDIEQQMKTGSEILHHYFKKLKSKDAAIQAYNIGLRNYNKGKEAPKYLGKYQGEFDRYKELINH